MYESTMDAGHQPLPSTLPYKERLVIKNMDGFSYARLYNNDKLDQPVWGRLHYDAGVRTSRALRPTPHEPMFAHPTGPFARRDELSGFVSNTKRAVYQPDLTFKTGHLKYEGEVPVESLMPLPLRRFKQKFALDYFAAIRPDAESTNQTLRMLGTYGTDFAHAERAQVFIPSGCPGGPAAGSWYHSDVRLTASADFSRPTRARHADGRLSSSVDFTRK